MKYQFATGLALLVLGGQAQPYAVGNLNIALYDPDRDRSIGCEVHYPATEAGDDTPVNDGQYPVLVIGHGFVMGTDAYAYLWQHYAPLGYIVVLPNTEAGFAPDHQAFGEDLAFLAEDLVASNEVPSSPFYQHVLPKAVLMGHSMGGGAAFLGAGGNGAITALVTLAPAETDPSAVDAAALVQVPTLVFAASEDCVTPIPDHQGPMYDAITVPCKAFVNITGGGHCYFGDDSFTCSFGELTCGPDLTISREQQHAVVTDITDLWLRYHVQEDDSAFAPMLDSLASTTRFIAETTCLSTAISAPGVQRSTFQAWFADARLNVQGCVPGEQLDLLDGLGRLIWTGRAESDGRLVQPAPFLDGVYVLIAGVGDHRRVRRPVLVH